MNKHIIDDIQYIPTLVQWETKIVIGCNRENVAGNVHCCCFIVPSSLIKFDHWIGFHGKIYGTKP